MDLPVWLLDVDGVVNANRAGWSAAPLRGYVTARSGPSAGSDFKMRWSGPFIARLRTLLADGCVEVRWCTTWCPEARWLEALFRLPELGVVLSDEQADPKTANANKLAAASHVLDVERRPLIWTDDEALPATFTTAGRPPALLLQPHPGRGIRPEHMDYIEHWVRSPR